VACYMLRITAIEGDMSSAAKRGLIIFGIELALLLGGLGFEHWRTGSASDAGGGAAIGGPFTLIDQDGKTRRDSDFRGELMLVYFGYTYCPDVCPTELQTMVDALERLGDRAKEVQPIFITVDPERDTPEHLKSYVAAFDPRLVGLTGTKEQIAEAARAYKVYYKAAKQANGEYLVDHSSFVFLMDREGRYAAHFGPNTTAEQMAATIQKRT
jgi:cytochrome oxidase Cu insertion factor (SCO1/SenC/PrrC family)